MSILTQEQLDRAVVHGIRDEADYRHIVASHREALDAIASSQKDTQRLDWLEKGHWDLVHTKALGGLWAVGNIDSDDELADAPTAREAIDRAMKGER